MPRFTELELYECYGRRYLEPGDQCGYLGEFYSHSGFEGEYNQLITNFKIGVNERHRLNYKYGAIRQVAEYLCQHFGTAMANYTFVPIPPSESKSNEAYDPRLLQVFGVCQQRLQVQLDVRDMLLQPHDLPKAHFADQGERPTPDYYQSVWTVDENLCNPPPNRVVIFDDVLTRGAHYRAAKHLLHRVFNCEIDGLFIAKTVAPREPEAPV